MNRGYGYPYEARGADPDLNRAFHRGSCYSSRVMDYDGGRGGCSKGTFQTKYLLKWWVSGLVLKIELVCTLYIYAWSLYNGLRSCGRRSSWRWAGDWALRAKYLLNWWVSELILNIKLVRTFYIYTLTLYNGPGRCGRRSLWRWGGRLRVAG